MSRASLALTSFVVLWLLVPAGAVKADGFTLDAAKMKVALHTATVEEGGFIEHVVDLAERGRLPVSLVESTFLWARKKPTHKFQYFRLGLILRARWLGIELYP
jgi:hypothetical protein